MTSGANQTAMTFTVTATDDQAADGGESVSIGFGTLPAGVFGGSPAAVATLAHGSEQMFMVNFGTDIHSSSLLSHRLSNEGGLNLPCLVE